MKNSILIILVLVLALFLLPSCVTPTFELGDWVIWGTDCAQISFDYKISAPAEVCIVDPKGTEISWAHLHEGWGHTQACIAREHQSPTPGTYKMLVVYHGKQTIFEKDFVLTGFNVSISQIQPRWTQDSFGNRYKLESIGIEVFNRGDLPVYISIVSCGLDAKGIGSDFPRLFVNPQQKGTFYFYPPGIVKALGDTYAEAGTHTLTVKIEDDKGFLAERTTSVSVP